jgi:hypothetical protein
MLSVSGPMGQEVSHRKRKKMEGRQPRQVRVGFCILPLFLFLCFPWLVVAHLVSPDFQY